jgi:outer membrane protein assembly factor BamB
MMRMAAIGLSGLLAARAGENLIADPSFEEIRSPDQFGHVFGKWAGWKYEGDCAFEVGQVAHSGKHSCLLAGYSGPKIRIFPPEREFEPGRYRVTAFLRGLDIGVGTYNQTTEFAFGGQFMPLHKNGTFGWTPLTYVGEIKERRKMITPFFGLLAPGLLWIDDVTMEKVPDDTSLTHEPVLGKEEAPIVPPGELGVDAVRCPTCGYRNEPAWKTCYACGSALEAKARRADSPPVKIIASFAEPKSPFTGKDAKVVSEHAPAGARALRLEQGFATMDGEQDWTGYDFLKADIYADAADPVPVCIELRDKGSRDYWTRVNYSTIVPPGQSTLTIPVKQLYVGEKSRPGRMLDLTSVTRVVIGHGAEKPAGPLFIDNIRLERDDAVEKARFNDLYAFDFGTGTSPVMDGFTAITPSTPYSKGRGYGLKNARIWRALDALQPDPLYQDFICIESGGLAVDVPNGTYHVFVNVDSPSGYWGEYQTYIKRAILAQGKPVISETMTFNDQMKKYFRFWDTEDLPTENTFDKYQKPYFHEKQFDVEVTNGQLNLEFQGENWACCVSAVVIYPVEKAVQGRKFLQFVEDRRRFYFDNYFKRILHHPVGDPLAPTAEDQARGYVLYHRDSMQDVYYNDTPKAGELCGKLQAQAFAGEYEPVTLSLVPLRDLGHVTVSVGDLKGPSGTIPAGAVDIGFVSYRVSRVTAEGSVYSIAPRLLMPTNTAVCAQGITRCFWLTVRTPSDAKPGVYKGSLTLRSESRRIDSVPIEFRVRNGTLDPVDIPAGPWGHTICVPWSGNDPAAAAFESAMTGKSLRRMRDYGFTTFSGAPDISYKGFKDGKPVLDFTRADQQMKQAKELGFLAVNTYGGGVSGISAYSEDSAALKAAGFSDYSAFIQAVYSAVQKHADGQGWLPVYYNLCDEPMGEDLVRATENAEAYRKAFPKGPPFFTGATSYDGTDPANPHFRLAQALTVANWNGHSEGSVKLLHDAGGDWAFYNGGNRWTYGDYLYKCAKEFGLKFRVSWHWNVVAGDPYYALDCREDDYAWCNASPDGRLVPSLDFERNREGLNDYRRLLTLARLAKEKAGMPAAQAAEKLIADRMASFHLGQRDHDTIFGADDWNAFRARIDDAIERLLTRAGVPGLRAAEAGWRGDGTGRALAAEPCLEWGGANNSNMQWKTQVGASFSSPVPVADRVFVTAEENKLACLDRRDGKILWQSSNGFADLPSAMTGKPETSTATSCGFTTPTPASEGERVYALFGTGIVACYDLAGRRQWMRYIEATERLEYGRSASPLLVGGRLVCMIGHLLALDTATGATVWETPNVAETYGTPVAAKLGSTAVIVAPNGAVVRAADGKMLATGIGEAVHTSPVVQNGVAFFADTHSVAVELTLKPDGKLATRELWQADLEGEFFASPVWHDGILYVVSNAGALQALDAATGKLIYRQTLDMPSATAGANFYASLAIADGTLFVANDKGDTLVVRPGREFKLARRNTLDDGAGSTPTFDGRTLFLRAGEALYAIGVPGSLSGNELFRKPIPAPVTRGETRPPVASANDK